MAPMTSGNQSRQMMPTVRANDNKHFHHFLFTSKTTQDAIRQISTKSNKKPTILSNTVGSWVNKNPNPNRQRNNNMGRAHQ